MDGLKPVLSAALILALSIAIIAALPAGFFNQWAGYLSISAIPAMVALNLFVRGSAFPVPADQPRTGLGLIAVSVIAGAVGAPAALVLFQGSLGPPSIVTTMFVIFGVVTMMWLSLVFGGWPFKRGARGGWGVGAAVWVAAYALAVPLFFTLFDFSAFGVGGRAPTGLFPAWPLIVFCITTLGVIFAFILFEKMPLVLPSSGQPLHGLATGALVLVISALVMVAGVWGLGMGVVDFMVRVPISFMFGMFMIFDTTHGQILGSLKQPLRGAVLTILCMAVGVGLYYFYGLVMGVLAPGLASGAPAYTQELWLANSMLSITFPVILIHMHFFDGWPIAGMGAAASALGGPSKNEAGS